MAHRIFIPALALAASALALSAPASAQLLGGSGGLGGGLGGTLGGTLGNPTGPIGGTIGSAGELAGSGRGEAKVDRRSGRIQGKGGADAHGSGSVDGGGALLGSTIGGNANGSGSASGSGSLDAQAVGTDFVGQTARGVVGTAQGAAATVSGTANGAAGTARDRAGGALPNVSGNGAGSGAGSFQGGLGQLAAAGSAAATGNGMFAVEPGMPVTDPRGKVIGHVQDVRQTGRGVVQAVTVEVGDRLATLPAASFNGAGNALVSGMTKGELKDVAKQQESAPGQSAPGLFGSLGGAGSGSGVFQGSLGQLAAAGSGAASGNGMFAVASGMPVTDPRGKVIGYVQDIRQTGPGVVQTVTVEVGDRLATLPAASFAGSGNVLVSGMTKGEIKDVAERQEEAAEAGQPASAAAPAAQPARPAQPAATDGAPRTKGGMRDREERGNTRNK